MGWVIYPELLLKDQHPAVLVWLFSLLLVHRHHCLNLYHPLRSGPAGGGGRGGVGTPRPAGGGYRKRGCIMGRPGIPPGNIAPIGIMPPGSSIPGCMGRMRLNWCMTGSMPMTGGIETGTPTRMVWGMTPIMGAPIIGRRIAAAAAACCCRAAAATAADMCAATSAWLVLGVIMAGAGAGCATGASGLGLGRYLAVLARISSRDTSSGGCTIFEPAPVAVTSGHEFAAGGFTSPFSFASELPDDVDVVGGALIVALL